MTELDFTLEDAEFITSEMEAFTQADRNRIDDVLTDADPYWTKTELQEYEDWLARMDVRMDMLYDYNDR